MLVLCRKQNERIMIGDSIVLTVVRIDRNQVRIGIEAPRDVAVYREELVSTRQQPDSHPEVLVPA
jgi:carbon storage regulator